MTFGYKSIISNHKNFGLSGPVYTGLDPNGIGSAPLFEGRLHAIGFRTVRIYTGSDPFGFYELFAAL